MLKKFFNYYLVLFLILALTSFSVVLSKPNRAEAAYDPQNLASDAAFINASSLTLGGIQSFLTAQGSMLANLSFSGQSAASLIYSAAQAYQVNPIVVLATLQKEQGLIVGPNSKGTDQSRYDWAMGYGCTDSGTLSQYQGFATQINYGTWQLKYNYNLYAVNGSAWNVGNTMVIDGNAIVFRTRATSSLYRYTPHLQGNYNFNYYFNAWGGEGYYAAQYLGQGPRSGIGVQGVALLPGQTFTVWVNYLNTGNTTWSKSDPTTPVHLGTWGPSDRLSPMGGNLNQRGILVQDSVAPGEVGTFTLNFAAPLTAGIYIERFRPVVENMGWFGPEMNWYYNVSPSIAARQTAGQYISQGPVRGPASPGTALAPGDGTMLTVTMLNTGSQPWFADGARPTKLGTWGPANRASVFTGGQSARGMLAANVYPGQTGTFYLWINAPARAGTYVEHFRALTEDLVWFGPDISFSILVQ